MVPLWVPVFLSTWGNLGLPITTTNLAGRTVVVTGANVGLGFEAAKHFYAMNPARLILAVRSMPKGEEAAKSISATGTDSGQTRIDVWQLDLSSFDSTKAFAAKANKELDRLDVFLANAGMSTGERNQTNDGWEVTLQTNVISTFMLAALLVPLLKKTAKIPPPVKGVYLRPHLVIVASGVHHWPAFPERTAPHILNSLNNQSNFSSPERYYVTKLLDVFLTRELAQSVELKGEDIVVCSVSPGFCRSELMRESPAVVRAALYLLFARTTEEGSRALLWASLSDEITPGAYSSSCKLDRPSEFVLSPDGKEVQKKLWKELKDIVLEVAPETENVWKTA